MGIEDVVDGKVTESPEPIVEAPQPEATAEAIEPTPEPAPEPVPEVPAVEEEPKHVPLPAFLDMRDGKKEAERRATEAERKLAEIEAAKTVKVPDPLDDPKGYEAHVEKLVTQQVTATRFNMSNVIAEQTHGKEAVEAALAWAEEKAKSDPTFVQSYMQSPHPVDLIVRQHKRDSLVGQLPEDVSSLDELVEREIAKRGLSAPAPAPAVAVSQQAPATPPRSLASQPSAGGVRDVPTGPLAALQAVFDR